MRPAQVLYPVAGLLFAAAAISPLLAQLASPASSSVSTVTPGSSTPTPTPVSGGLITTSSRLPARTLRMLLPDPALLDGAKLAPDKYPEYGMIGDFELPGDDVTDPAQNQRVGVSNPNQTEPTAGGSAKMDPNQKGGGGASQAKADQAGGGGASQDKSGASGGAEQAKSDKSGNGSSGNSGGSNAAGGTKAGGKSPGRNDPNAKAEGIQVGELRGSEDSPQIDVTGVPIEIGVGDSAMAIKPVAAATGVTGKESAGNTQQSSKAAGPAQGGAGGSSGNRGAERGKTMPSGL